MTLHFNDFFTSSLELTSGCANFCVKNKFVKPQKVTFWRQNLKLDDLQAALNTLTCQIIVQQILLFFGEKKPTQPRTYTFIDS